MESSANTNTDKLITFGQMALEQGWYDQAREYFEQALALDPSNREAMKGLARANEILSRREAMAIEPIEQEPPQRIERKRRIPKKEMKERKGSPIQWFMRQSSSLKIAVLIGGSLLLLCLCNGLASLTIPTPEATPTPAPTNTPRLLPTWTPRPPKPTPKATPTPKPTRVKPTPTPSGPRWHHHENAAVAVVEVQETLGPMYLEAAPGYTYICFYVNYAHTGSTGTVFVSEFDFRLEVDNVIYEPTLPMCEPSLKMVDLMPGGKITGWVTFEAPVDFEQAELLWETPGLFGPTIPIVTLRPR